MKKRKRKNNYFPPLLIPLPPGERNIDIGQPFRVALLSKAKALPYVLV